MKSIVLLSSGLDSTVNFCKALRETEVVLALTFDYGQRVATNESEQARKICERYHVPHKVISLPWLRDITQTALVNKNRNLPVIETEALDQLSEGLETAKQVWVPNRNGVFINVAAAFAERLDADQIIVGFNAEEAKTFPDNSEEYIESVNGCLEFSTLQQPKVVGYTSHMTKNEIVMLGRELKAPFDLMWSCYESGQEQCRQCESCKRFIRATEATHEA